MSLYERYNRFLSLYYLYNVFVILTYFVWRHLGYYLRAQYSDFMVSSKESQILVTMGTLLVLKLFRSSTPDQFASTVFLFSKASIVFLSVATSQWYLTFFYVVLIGVGILIEQPVYRGRSKIQIITPTTLRSRVIESKNAVNEAWVVIFYTTWSPPCRQLSQLFADLSVEYGNDQIHFGKIDVGRYAEAASNFQISTEGTSKQLPTLVLFEKGKETRRLPKISKDRSVATVNFSIKLIEQSFGLNDLRNSFKDLTMKREKYSNDEKTSNPRGKKKRGKKV